MPGSRTTQSKAVESLYPPFLDGGGEAGRLIAGIDWTATPLGPLAQWPASVKHTVALLLRSPVPMVLVWGAEGIMIYNDAYARVVGSRHHPSAMGSKCRESWPEIACLNLAYSPVLDDDGRPGGVIAIVSEPTEAVGGAEWAGGGSRTPQADVRTGAQLHGDAERPHA